jgi:hypothetical protein
MKSIPENRMGVVCMPVKLFSIFLLFLFFHFNSLQAQFLNPGNGVIMYDNAEKLPQTGWGMDFTKGYAMVTGGSQSTTNPDPRANITLSTDYARKGTRSYKMHLEKRTDYPGCCQWVRSEVMWMSPSQQTIQNEYRWAAVSILIAPSFQFENRPTQIGFDTKASPDDLQTPFWLGIMNGQYYIDGYFIGGTKYLGPVIKGVWEDWLLERNWKTDASGFIRFYRNGKLVFEKYGANYFGRSGDAPIARMQHGLYKWVWATSNGQGWGEGSPVAAANAPMDIYLDEIRFGSPAAKLSDFLLDQTAPVNQAPTAAAGNNQTITLPVNTVTLQGSGTDPDGNIASYQWTKLSGPAGGAITTPNAANTIITGLLQGVYTFRLTVTDNNGATATDDVQVTVNAALNLAPVADAGADQSITLPVNSVTLNGSGTDADGSISGYLWSKVSGPAGGSIQSATAASTSVTGLAQGIYIFRLTVTDNSGATATNDIQVTVNAAPVVNTAPIAIAGADQTITLPVNTVSLNGSGTDADGTIASYVWTKVSGPAGGNISSANTAASDITNLQQGVYVFRLTVTDNDGATATNDVQVTVNAAPVANTAPVAIAGADQTITLPLNSVTLNGSGTDADGSIASYAWTKVSGPAGGDISSANTAATDITNLQQGVYVFRLTVTDNDGATATNDVQVTVNAAPVANTAPVAVAGADQTITLPLNTVTLNGSGTDADGSIASYAWTKVSGPAGGDISSANTAATDITNLQQGVYVFRLTVTDNDGVTATNDVQVTVNAAPVANTAPTAVAGADQSITLPVNTVTLNGSGTDADGTIASYVWTKVSGPSGGDISSANTAATDITNLQQGVYVFRLTVTDNDGATATNDVQITVNAAPVANTAPTAVAGADQTITLPVNTVTLNGSGTDADGTISSYTWTKVSGPAGGNITSANTAATDITNLQQGVYVFRLTITDNDGATATNDVQITVNAAPVANTAPVAVAGADQTITLPVNTVSLNGSGTDADGTIASYAWTKVSGPAGGNITSANTDATDITNLQQGVYVFRLTVTDNDGATATNDVQITVNAAPVANTAPTAIAGADQTITLPLNTVTLNGSGTDADGTIASYAWTKVSGPAGGNITSANTAATAITSLQQGIYVFRLTVTDNDGATATNDVQVTVNAAPVANQSPVAQAGANQTITLPTSSVGLSGNGSDGDGTIASYSWTKVSGPAGGTIQTADAAATQITGLVAGTYVFRLTVTDDKGATGSDDVQVVVNASAPAPNAAPQADPGADKTITLPTNSVTLAGRGTDSDGLIADYTWTKVSGPAGGAIQNNDAASTLVTGLIAGTYTYRLTVTDNDGATASADVRVIVNAAPAPTPNVAPSANAGPNQVITLPVSSVSVSGTATDSDGRIASYEWTKVSGPNGGNISSASTASTQITGLTAGTYVFRLTVTDNDGDSDSDDMLVVVNAAAANLPPTAAAGSNITIRLPANAVTLNGSGADADGQIVSYRWTKISGPNPGNFQSATSQSTGMNNLREGTYVVRLTVTDNDGATATDDITIVVNPAPATPQPPANVAPTANAGANRSITLPVDVVTLNGVGTDVDGTIASFRWSKVSGPAAGSLSNTTAQSTGVTGLVAGTYVFRLTVTDNDGAQGNDDVQVTVNAAAVPPVNVAPSATAGNDRTVTLPISTVNLNGTAVDPDGSVVSYRWLKVSGPGAGVIQAATSPATSVVNLTEGEYVYRLTVTDNKGAQGSDELKVTVRAAAPLPNQLPVANAGADISVTLPANTAALNGSRSSDPDGTISSYKWVMVSGPVSGDITNSTTVSPTLSDLVKGEYVFELTVTDNDGASATDRVTVTVVKNNKLPVVQSRDTVTVLLPSQNTELDASQSYDPDGSISSYSWEKKSGPGSPKILSPNGGKTIITDLLQGNYNYEVTVTDNDGDAVKKLVTVLVKNSTARRLIPVVNLYPNPAETNITLTFDAEVDGRSDVTFYDLLGRIVLKDTFMKNSRTFTRRINISSLPAGVYAVEIAIAEAEKVVRKVVKQ